MLLTSETDYVHVNARLRRLKLETSNRPEEIKKSYKNSKIIVSHRISSIKDCDNIIVMDDGEIIQSGKHNDLINTNGYYKNLFLEQSNNKD